MKLATASLVGPDAFKQILTFYVQAASFYFQIAVFLVIYLQACVVYKGKKSILIVPFFQVKITA